jgi:hypothetical protein
MAKDDRYIGATDRYITVGELVEDNERLREALREIIAAEPYKEAVWMKDRARKALGFITPPNAPPPSD